MHPLWEEVLDQLKHHMKKQDATPIAALNRILRKHYHFDGVQTETHSVARLRLAKPAQNLHHVSMTQPPFRQDIPVVVVRESGSDYVVDGNKRVSAWLRDSRFTSLFIRLSSMKSPG